MADLIRMTQRHIAPDARPNPSVLNRSRKVSDMAGIEGVVGDFFRYSCTRWAAGKYIGLVAAEMETADGTEHIQILCDQALEKRAGLRILRAVAIVTIRQLAHRTVGVLFKNVLGMADGLQQGDGFQPEIGGMIEKRAEFLFRHGFGPDGIRTGGPRDLVLQLPKDRVEAHIRDERQPPPQIIRTQVYEIQVDMEYTQ